MRHLLACLLSFVSELELTFWLSGKLLLKNPKQTVRLMNEQITVCVCRELIYPLFALLQNFSWGFFLFTCLAIYATDYSCVFFQTLWLLIKRKLGVFWSLLFISSNIAKIDSEYSKFINQVGLFSWQTWTWNTIKLSTSSDLCLDGLLA